MYIINLVIKDSHEGCWNKQEVKDLHCEEKNINKDGHIRAVKSAGEKFAAADFFIANVPPEYTRKQISQAVKWLARHDIRTMEALYETSHTHLKRLRGIGYPILRLVLLLRERYAKVRNETVGGYFVINAADNDKLVLRAANALERAGIDTMEKLCAMDFENLRKVRNVGEKSMKTILAMREKYEAGHEKHT